MTGPIGGARTFGARTFDLSRRVVVMAIVNRTRDSFSDKGRSFALDKAVAAAQQAIEQGADWVDFGAVPFSPLAREVGQDEELDRLLPLVEAVRATSDVVISVDTFRPEVARQALAAGADAINDTSGLRDPAMADVAARAGAVLVVTHSRAAPRERLPRPEYTDVVAEVRAFLADRARLAQDHGVAPEKIVVDPGHDLNKNTLHSLEITRRLGELTDLGFPVLASVSNKDFVAESLGTSVGDLTEGTLAAVVMCVVAGARIVRVHDVAAMRAGLTVLEAVLGWRSPPVLRHNRE